MDVSKQIHELNKSIREKYQRMHKGKNTCPACGEAFEISISNDGYPNRDNELVSCPNCSKVVGYVRTSGIISSEKIE